MDVYTFVIMCLSAVLFVMSMFILLYPVPGPSELADNAKEKAVSNLQNAYHNSSDPDIKINASKETAIYVYKKYSDDNDSSCEGGILNYGEIFVINDINKFNFDYSKGHDYIILGDL
jgi:hypothetical protein